ncbi:MAG: class I SAM-dependent RNA methyltransferase [Vicinamibacterales bacterium]
MARFLNLRIERPVAGGAMLAHYGGRVVLVEGAIPGERVDARVDRERRDVLFATVISVVEPDSDRRAVESDPACGGQAYLHIKYDRQRQLKSQVIADTLRRMTKLDAVVPVPVTPSQEQGYRMRARLHAGSSGLGFLRGGTHTLCNVARTGQLLPETNRVVSQVGRRLSRSKYRGVTHVDLAESMNAEMRVMNFHLAAPSVSKLVAEWTRGCALTGVTCSKPGSAEIKVISGTPTIFDPVGSLLHDDVTHQRSIARHARSFFQGNRYVLSALVTSVCRRVTADPVLDLYAGVGLFSVALASLGVENITAVERDASARRDLVSNASGTQIDVIGTSVEEFLSRSSDVIPGTVIVDPPRAGLGRNVVDLLVQRRVSSLVYVSCDVATFARDLQRLGEAGYAVEDIEAFDMFPNSAHIEVMASLRR